MVEPPMALSIVLLFVVPIYTQVISPLAQRCGPPSANIVCINHYSSVMPGDFYRKPINNSVSPTDDLPYEATMIQDDPSFALAANADFLVFDQKRGLELLGPNSKNEFMFTIAEVFHDAPVYAPITNELYFSQFEPGFLPQLAVDLNRSPPTLSRKLANPPLYSANGGTYHNGLIYYCVGGGNASIDVGSGYVSRPGIYTLNATTGESNVLLNNYFGYYFNTCDDITVDNKGDVWFTDNYSSWGNKVNAFAPVLGCATYRFRPTTGTVSLIDDTLSQPNGIAFSPSGKTLYITDTGAVSPIALQQYGQLGYSNFNITGKHTVYAFDVLETGNGIANKRPLYLSKQWIPDGLKVARNGYVLTGAGNGVDILDDEGSLLVTIRTNYTAVNMNWSGQDLDILWIVGVGGVSRITFNLPGPVLV